MFRITTQTCHAFTFGEILILAAMNLETVRLDSAFALPEQHGKDCPMGTAPDPKTGAALNS